MIKCNKFVATLFSVTLLLGNLPKALANENIQNELSNNCVTNVYEELNSTQRLVLALGQIEQQLVPYCLQICAQLSGVSIETLYEHQRNEMFAAVKKAIPNTENHPFLMEGWQYFSNSFSYAIIAAGVNSYCPRYQEDLDNLKTRLEEEIEDDNDNLPYVIDNQYRI